MGASRGGAHGGVAGKPPRLVLSPEVGAGERASPLQSFCPILASITADLIPGGLDVGLVSRRQHHGGFFLSLCKDQKSGARGVCGTFMPEAQGARPSRPRSLARFQKVQGRVCDPKSWGGLVSQGLPHSMEPAQAEIQLLGYPLLQLLRFPGAHTGFRATQIHAYPLVAGPREALRCLFAGQGAEHNFSRNETRCFRTRLCP